MIAIIWCWRRTHYMKLTCKSNLRVAALSTFMNVRTDGINRNQDRELTIYPNFGIINLGNYFAQNTLDSSAEQEKIVYSDFRREAKQKIEILLGYFLKFP